jgi:hypothetical protein
MLLLSLPLETRDVSCTIDNRVIHLIYLHEDQMVPGRTKRVDEGQVEKPETNPPWPNAPRRGPCRLVGKTDVSLGYGKSGDFKLLTVGDRETWAPLPVLFWRVSLAALSSREPGERLGEQGEPGGVIPRLRHPPLRLRAQTQRCCLAGYFWPPYEGHVTLRSAVGPVPHVKTPSRRRETPCVMKSCQSTSSCGTSHASPITPPDLSSIPS